jgi:hypothetical protein
MANLPINLFIVVYVVQRYINLQVPQAVWVAAYVHMQFLWHNILHKYALASSGV